MRRIGLSRINEGEDRKVRIGEGYAEKLLARLTTRLCQVFLAKKKGEAERERLSPLAPLMFKQKCLTEQREKKNFLVPLVMSQ